MFETEHYLGSDITGKWNTFIQNYTHEYDVNSGRHNTQHRIPAHPVLHRAVLQTPDHAGAGFGQLCAAIGAAVAPGNILPAFLTIGSDRHFHPPLHTFPLYHNPGKVATESPQQRIPLLLRYNT